MFETIILIFIFSFLIIIASFFSYYMCDRSRLLHLNRIRNEYRNVNLVDAYNIDEINDDILININENKELEEQELKKIMDLCIKSKIKKDNISYSCIICLEEFKDSDNIKELSCNHYFHYDCLIKWMDEKMECPLCKHNILEDINLIMKNYENFDLNDLVLHEKYIYDDYLFTRLNNWTHGNNYILLRE